MPKTLRTYTYLALTLLAASAFLVPAAGASDCDFGLRAGVYTEEPDPFVGFEGLTRLGSSSWFFNPNVEIILVDNGDAATLNADFHYDFDVDLPVYLWVGGGPAVLFYDRDLPRQARANEDDTDFGANFLFGVGFKTQSTWRPYAQAKIFVGDEDEAVLAVGVRF